MRAGWQRASALGLVVFAACQGDAELVRVDLEDGAYVRGTHVVHVSLGEDAGERLAVGARLFIDRELVASANAAPFELAWDTSRLVDGAHDVRVQLQLADGLVERSLSVAIDNTPPEVLQLIASRADGDTWAYAKDNLGLAKLEAGRVGAMEPPILAANPSDAMRWTWRWSCQPTDVQVTATDRAGNATTQVFHVEVSDADDVDCDGYRSLAAGGDDCDDFSALTHPGASEVPEGFDLSCDGRVEPLAGVDSDGDGVRSLADGGDDCDDQDPSVHGGAYAFTPSPVLENGEPVTWAPGDAASFYEYLPGENRSSLAVLRGDRVTWTRFRTGQPNELTTLATNANAGAISLSYGDYLAYGSGNQVVLLHRVDGSWTTAASFDAGGRVDRVKLQSSNGPGSLAVAVLVAGQLRIANDFAGRWQVEAVKSAPTGLSAITSAWILKGGGMSIVARAGDAALRLQRDDAKSPLQATQLNPPGTRVTAISTNNQPELVAVADGTGSRLLNTLGARTTLLVTAQPITAISAIHPYVLAQLQGGELLTLAYDDGALMRIVGSSQLAPLDPDASPFAGAGFVYAESASWISPAPDAPDDGIDRNCDRRD